MKEYLLIFISNKKELIEKYYSAMKLKRKEYLMSYSINKSNNNMLDYLVKVKNTLTIDKLVY